MHKYIQNHFINIDAKPMLGKLARPKTTDNFIYPTPDNSENFYKSIPELNDYIRDYKDPSLGPRHLEKMYPYCHDVF